MVFNLASVSADGDSHAKLTGELSLPHTNAPLTIDVEVSRSEEGHLYLSGETKIVTMANCMHSDGTDPAGNHYLSGYTLTLNGKSVQSIT